MHCDTHRLKFLGRLGVHVLRHLLWLSRQLALGLSSPLDSLVCFLLFHALLNLAAGTSCGSSTSPKGKLFSLPASIYSATNLTAGAASREALRSVGFSMRRLFNTWKQTADVVESMPIMHRSKVFGVQCSCSTSREAPVMERVCTRVVFRRFLRATCASWSCAIARQHS